MVSSTGKVQKRKRSQGLNKVNTNMESMKRCPKKEIEQKKRQMKKEIDQRKVGREKGEKKRTTTITKRVV